MTTSTAMITIQVLDGKHALVVMCDICGHRIDDFDHAVAVYEQPGSPVTFHHHDCEDEHTHQHKFSMPLYVALVQLARGLNLDWQEALANERRHAAQGITAD